VRVFVTSTLLEDESHLLDGDALNWLVWKEDDPMMADLCAAKAAIADDDRHDAALRSRVALFRHVIAFIFYSDVVLEENEWHQGMHHCDDAFDFFNRYKIFLKSHFIEPSFYKTCCRHASDCEKVLMCFHSLKESTRCRWVGWLAVAGLGLKYLSLSSGRLTTLWR